MKQLILVFLGGGIGTVLRFIISKLIPHNDSGFPWSTFSANLIGCFIIGLISGYFFKLFQMTNQILYCLPLLGFVVALLLFQLLHMKI